MSDTWKGVPPPSQHPPGRPFSDEQEARIRTMIREEQSRAAMIEADARERRLQELVRHLENGTLRLPRQGSDA